MGRVSIFTRSWQQRLLDNDPRGLKKDEAGSRLRRAALRVALLVLLCTTLTWAVRLLFPARGVWETSLLVALGLYAVVTEAYRVRPLSQQRDVLQQKVQQLMEARRAAGLQRLEQDIHLRRLSGIPRGTAIAFLQRTNSNSSSVGRNAANHSISEASLSAFASGAAMRLAETARARKQSRDPAASTEINTWLFKQLCALGPQPDEHEDLYRIMHHSLDELEAMGAIVAEVGYYCRLCLGYQELRRGMPAVLERGRKLCPGCCRGLVDGALDGKVHVPITIPVGDAEVVLTPALVAHIVPETQLEHFRRVHEVKSSLGISAPHGSRLAQGLAEARALMAAGAGARPNGDGSAPGSPAREGRAGRPEGVAGGPGGPGAWRGSADWERSGRRDRGPEGGRGGEGEPGLSAHGREANGSARGKGGGSSQWWGPSPLGRTPPRDPLGFSPLPTMTERSDGSGDGDASHQGGPAVAT